MNIIHEITVRRDEITELISKSETREAIARILDFAKDTQFGSEDLKRYAIQLSSRYNYIRDREMKGVASFDILAVEHNKLIDDMIGFLDKVIALNSIDHTHTEVVSASRTSYIEERNRFFETLEREKERNTHFNTVCLAENISKQYRKSPTPALRNISLEISHRDIIGVVGENASGKSTLLKIVCGELAPSAGRLSFPNLERKEWFRNWLRIKSKIGYVPQHLENWSGTLIDNLTFAAAVAGIKGRENEKEVAWMIERLGLAPYRDYKCSELSGGYRMRFELARVLIRKPKLLVLDEPMANLDINTQARFLQDLRDIGNSLVDPLGIIISSQHIHEVESICNKMIFLSAGEVRFNDDFEALGQVDEGLRIYELSTEPAIPDVEAFFQELQPAKVIVRGPVLSVYVPKQITDTVILRHLMERQTALKYFREITASSKKLFSG